MFQHTKKHSLAQKGLEMHEWFCEWFNLIISWWNHQKNIRQEELLIILIMGSESLSNLWGMYDMKFLRVFSLKTKQRAFTLQNTLISPSYPLAQASSTVVNFLKPVQMQASVLPPAPTSKNSTAPIHAWSWLVYYTNI